MKKISIVTPTFNEEENVLDVYQSVRSVLSTYKNYDYEHVFIDNASTNRTVSILKDLAKKDPRVKLIVNSRDFGHIRSPMYAFFTVDGDAVSIVAADLQDPPPLLSKFIAEWEKGYKIIVGVRKSRDESWIYWLIRKSYYRLVNRLSDMKLVQNFHGYGLYDREAVEALRKMRDPYPYFRGMVCEIGFERSEVPYDMPGRKKGVTKNNFYSLYDMAMLGLVNHSKVPLCLAVFLGFGMAFLSLGLATAYLMYKLLYWDKFTAGTAPVVIGVFLLSSIQLIFMGFLGEYLGSV